MTCCLDVCGVVGLSVERGSLRAQAREQSTVTTAEKHKSDSVGKYLAVQANRS